MFLVKPFKPRSLASQMACELLRKQVIMKCNNYTQKQLFWQFSYHIFPNSHENTWVNNVSKNSLSLNNVAGYKAANLLKRDSPAQAFSYEFFDVFQNSCF